MNYQNRPGGGSPQARPPEELPQPKLKKYFDASGNIRADLVDAEAEQCAKNFREIPPTQLRRFYEHVIGLRRRLDECVEAEKSGEFERLRPEFKMLKAKAVYAASRDNKKRHAMQPLLEFFVDHTASVREIRDFTAFCRHFEAVVAFHKFYGKEEGR